MDTPKKINILQLVNGFAIGGGEIKLLELIEKLDKEKYKIVVCSVGQGGPLQSEFERVCPRVVVFEKRHRFDIGLIFKLVKLMRQERIDIVQTTLLYADILGAVAAKIAGVPFVVSWDVVTQPFKTLHKMAYSVAKRNMNLVVTVSDAINRKTVAERNMPVDRVKTIHYGVDLDKFNTNGVDTAVKRRELGLSEDELLVGVVARLNEQKGHKYLVAAAPEIVKQFPHVRFVFVGDGPLRADIEKQIDDLGISRHFTFLGFRDDVHEILKVFDIFVLPSLYEGLPNVVLEAMAAGKPIIATAVDGTPEAVADGETGLLVPSREPEPLKSAIIKLVSDEKTRLVMARNARKRAESHFSLEKQVRAFENLYDTCLS
jgi:glycosyltransferase involved in cell wall biosynthesis